MSLHFIFESPDRSQLKQGDLLQKNPALKEVISQAHKYYSDADHYTHFMVITQSCDLALRGGKVKSSYITLAAAKPLTRVLQPRLADIEFSGGDDLPLKAYKRQKRQNVEQFLERLVHNTADGMFFIPKDANVMLADDICVDLSLSIALRAHHYESILQAKIGELKEIFAAKVGWLAGNIYSRVATADVEEKLGIGEAEKYKKKFYERSLQHEAFWLSDMQFRKLKERSVEQKKAGQPAMTADQVQTFLDGLPTEYDDVVSAIVDRLIKKKVLDEAQREEAKNVLLSDAAVQASMRKFTD